MVQALWLGAAAVVGIAALVLLVLWITRQAQDGEVSVRIGDPTFRPGLAETMARFVDEQGPWLVPDVAGGDRDLVLQHLGEDPTSGWYAFAARPEGAPRDCVVEWQPDTQRFVDSCDATAYPPDGSGLPQFPVTVDDEGELEVVVVPSNVDPKPTGG